MTAVTVVVVLTVQREEWMTRAACRGLGPAIFYPPQGQPIDHLRALCQACPVRLDCLAYALDHHERTGFWGGSSSQERRVLQRQRAQSAA